VLKNIATEGAMNPMETTIASNVERAPPLRPSSDLDSTTYSSLRAAVKLRDRPTEYLAC
jgi:hypothetical protein